MKRDTLAPQCPRCREQRNGRWYYRRHRPDLPCWRGKYAQRITAHILATQGRRCWICGGLASSADHQIPRSRGGDDTDENLRPACLTHNSARGNRLNPFKPDTAETNPANLSARWRNLSNG